MDVQNKWQFWNYRFEMEPPKWQSKRQLSPRSTHLPVSHFSPYENCYKLFYLSVGCSLFALLPVSTHILYLVQFKILNVGAKREVREPGSFWSVDGSILRRGKSYFASVASVEYSNLLLSLFKLHSSVCGQRPVAWGRLLNEAVFSGWPQNHV